MSPRSSEQFEEIRQASRQKILDAALELFAYDGYHTTSMSKVAKKAGVSKGLIYNYFNSKEELLKSMFDSFMDDVDDLFTEMKQRSPEEQLRTIIEASFQMAVSDDKHWRLATTVLIQPDVLEIMRDYSIQATEGKLKYMEHLMSQLGFEQPRTAAFALGATLDGIGLGYMTLGDAYPLDDMKEMVLDQYCKTDNS